MGKVAYLVITDERSGVATYWLLMALTEDWNAAYRLTFVGRGRRRHARVEELRIVQAGPPGDRFRFSPHLEHALWAEARKRKGGHAPAPLPYTDLRRGLTERHLKDALLAARWPLEDEEDDATSPPRKVEPSPARRSAGRPGKPRSFYADFAIDYEKVEHDEGREPGTSSRKILAKNYGGEPETTIARWVHTARRLKFLTPVVPGQRGGRATPLAYKLSKRGQK